MKKVTIISLTYNNWQLLPTAISSVINQKIPENYKLEYLIVDDGSESFDVQLVKSMLVDSSFDYRIIVNKENLGTVRSFNRAIRESTGHIIIPLSADDSFYDEKVVFDVIQKFDIDKCKILTGIRVPTNNGIEYESLPLKKERVFFLDQARLLKRIALKGNIISGSSTYYSRDVLIKLNYFDESYRLLEDYPFYIKALLNGVNIDFMERNVIKYGTDGLSSSIIVHPILKADLKYCNRFIHNNVKMSAFQKRNHYYSRVLMKSDKLKFRNIVLYFDQLIFHCIRTLTAYLCK